MTRNTTDISAIRARLHDELPRLATQYHVASLALFGSYVRGDQRPDSDIDVLVAFTKIPGLIRFVQLENELSDLLEVKVDLVMRESLKPHIGQEVMATAIPV